MSAGHKAGLGAWRCERGHVFLHAHAACPECGSRLLVTRVGRDARLIVVTTVRVTASGEWFDLGVAVTRCGRAHTLCVVDGAVRGSGRDPVVLEHRGDRIVARPRRVRVQR